jgi:hypothetical protein
MNPYLRPTMGTPLLRKKQMNNKIAFSMLGFTAGIISMWAFMAYWNNPIHDWSTVIEDRCMYYEARSDARNSQARQGLWEEMQEINEVAYTNNTRVNNMLDPHGYYMTDVVREAAEMLYFAEYMWAENFYPMDKNSYQEESATQQNEIDRTK